MPVIAEVAAVRQGLSAEDLNHALDVQHHLKNLSHTFEKLGI